MQKSFLIQRIRELSELMEPIATGESPRLQKLEDVRCIAFDFYGTMFISGVGDIGVDEGISEEGIRMFAEALSDTGYKVKKGAGKTGLELFEEKIREYRQQHISEKIDIPEPDIVEVWEKVLRDLVSGGDIEGDVSRQKAEHFAVEYEFRFNAVWPVPGLQETLGSLKKSGFTLGIISNSQFYTPLAFEALTSAAPGEVFDPSLMIWSYQTGVKKPSIHFYQHFMDALEQQSDFKPKEVLFVGNDMLKDIMPASKLGMKTALFAGDRRSLKLRDDHPECRGIEPDVLITELGQLSDCVS